MADANVTRMAQVLVDYSTAIQPGDTVLIEATTLAEELVREVYRRVLERGGHPHLLLSLPDQEEIFYTAASRDEQFDFVPALHHYAAENFDARIRIYSEGNTRGLNSVNPARQARRQKALSVVQRAVFRRAAEDQLRWVSTLFPTQAYAMEAGMGWHEYRNFVFSACAVDGSVPDPVAYWQEVGRQQQKFISAFQGHDRVTLRGANVDLTLSIRERRFLNSCGIHNMPDGEIYTGPVEDSVEGWVRFTYPAIYGGRAVEGVELTFEKGQVVKASARTNAEFLEQTLNSDPGARYLGEFAIGTNFHINRFTGNILFDEKIGGTFHLALGNSYPETGGRNQSAIHWDMICDLRTDSEILVDGEVVYRNGAFLI